MHTRVEINPSCLNAVWFRQPPLIFLAIVAFLIFCKLCVQLGYQNQLLLDTALLSGGTQALVKALVFVALSKLKLQSIAVCKYANK